MVKRYYELDSIRGIAALTVMINHFFNVIPSIYNVNLFTDNPFLKMLKYSPLHLIWAGHEAVILFFVLSGFVLALPFLDNRQGTYKGFLIKRFFRIYIPYLIAIIVAILFRISVSRNGIEELGVWFNFAWTDPVTWSQILNHLILVGDFKNYVYDPVIWSLTHELRISLVFPFLILIVIRFKFIQNLILAIILSGISYYIKIHVLYKTNYIDYSTSFVDSLHYISMFIVGALLAKNRERLITIFNHKVKIVVGLCIAVLFYTYPWWFLVQNSKLHSYVLNDWMITIGASLFIVISMSSQKISKMLKNSMIRYLGKISFSLYLFHSIVLLAFIHLWYGVLPYWLIIVLAFPTAIIISSFAFHIIEKPSMKLGAKIVAANRNRN